MRFLCEPAPDVEISARSGTHRELAVEALDMGILSGFAGCGARPWLAPTPLKAQPVSSDPWSVRMACRWQRNRSTCSSRHPDYVPTADSVIDSNVYALMAEAVGDARVLDVPRSPGCH